MDLPINTPVADRRVCPNSELLEAMREREALARQAVAEQLAFLAEAQDRGIPAEAGARSTVVWLRELLNLDEREARSRVVVSNATSESRSGSGAVVAADLPATAHALRSGQITVAHARVITDGIRKLPPSIGSAERAETEGLLSEHACMRPPREVRILAERMRYQLDQDGASQEEQHQIATRELHVATARDGMIVVKGRLDRETGAKLRAVLDPLAAPRSETDGMQDPRSAGQRNADGFAALLDLTLASGQHPSAGGARPQITVTLNYDNLTEQLQATDGAGSGTLENTGQPVSGAQVRRMACDADILPVVLDGQSQPLDVGRSRRTAPPHLRAALLARDGACAFPRCDHPPGTSEAHHVRHWADGGDTASTNMAMLCPHHHRTVHNEGWHIDLTAGRPQFTPPGRTDNPHQAEPGNQTQSCHRDQPAHNTLSKSTAGIPSPRHENTTLTQSTGAS